MKGLKVFISYNHTDENLCKQLISHLSSLMRTGMISEWYDRKIISGEEWDKSIKQELFNSGIILLLISSDFIASDYCYDIEISKAMEMHEQKNAVVIPIVLRPCDWKDLPFSKIQGLPKDAKPITTWTNIDEAFVDTIEGIKAVVKAILKNKNELSRPSAIKEETDFIVFNSDVVLCKLPRGYIVIEGIDYHSNNQWAVIASYFKYDGTFQSATHYHESYRRNWETLDGHYIQCRKLSIPKADSNYADSAIEIMMRLRERKENESAESIINLHSPYKSLNYFYLKNTKIPKPTIPDRFQQLNKNGELRDIIEDLNISLRQTHELKTLHENAESLRRKAQISIYDNLSSNHPAYRFVEEIVNGYKSDFSYDDLKKWSGRLSDALFDTFKYIQ